VQAHSAVTANNVAIATGDTAHRCMEAFCGCDDHRIDVVSV